MKILLTGATGFIGSAVARRLSTEYEITCAVRSTSDRSRLQGTDVQYLLTDTGTEQLYQEMAAAEPDLVIHMAGVFYSEHNRETIDNLLQSNVVYATKIFDAACEAGCQAFINTGSCWQNYEGETYNPVNLYAATKQAAEDILDYYVHARDCRAIHLTIFDSYGPDDSRRKILNILRDTPDGGTIGMSGGQQKMYLTYVDDIVDAYVQTVKLIQNMPDGTAVKYAVRGNRPHSLREIAEAYLKASGKRIDIHWGERPYRNREIMDPTGWGDPVPGWKPGHSLESGMEAYVKGGEKY